MVAFRYEVMDVDGRRSHGVLEADGERVARGQLRDQGLYVVAVERVERSYSGPRRIRLSVAELSLLTRQWSTLLSSGLTLEECLDALIAQSEKDMHRQLLAGVRSDLMAGYSLRAALDRYPGCFPDLYRASIGAGEQSGRLPGIMLQLADYFERQHSLRSKTLQALIYPCLVAVVALVVVVGLMTYVVPQVVRVFQHTRQSLPLLTQLMILLSDFIRQWGWTAFPVLFGAGFGLRRGLARPAFRERWDRFWLGVPLLGWYLRALDVTRFASTLAILLQSGVPLLRALEAGRQVMVRQPLVAAVAQASERVREGAPLAQALATEKIFPALLVHMIANGEATGRIGELLDRAARLQQAELEQRTGSLTAVFEPLILLGMGGFVLLVVLAVMQPIIEINTMLK